jgi:histidinol-phosphatase
VSAGGPAAGRDTPEGLRRFALDLVAETDPIALRHFAGELRISTKPDRTLVTQADTEVEAHLRQRISAAYPAHGIVGEELGVEPGDGETRWIVDPIDGTHNYVRGIGVWATLIAVERGGELLAAVASAPALGQRWHAARGGGAATQGGNGRDRPIHVSSIGSLEEAQVVYSTLRSMDRAGLGDTLRATVARAWRDRGFGDFWGYMLVAQGSAEVMLETGVKVWDLAAPALIVREAGGRFSGLDGTPGYAGPGALATNGLLHEEMLRILPGDRDPPALPLL